jgi:hypothetical protein
VVVNGLPVAARTIPADGSSRELSLEVPIERSSWVAVRTFPHAHTNPIFVLVRGRPTRAPRRSAERCPRGVDQCWKVKQPTYAKGEAQEAERAYEHASAAYRRIAGGCGGPGD